MSDAPRLSRFEPYEVVVTTGTFLIGILGASLLHRVPPSAERVVPTWGLYVFFAALIVSSAVVLYGILVDTLAGLQLRRGASYAQAGLCGALALWTVGGAGVAAYRSVILLSVITIAALWQAQRIHRALRPRRKR